MFNKLGKVALHLVGFAGVCAIAAYWVVKIVTPSPTTAPPPLPPPPLRDPDTVAAARMFGLVQTAPTAVVTNVQVAGVFAAGNDSSAVLIIDGKPARAYLLGAEVAPGSRLVAVTGTGVTIEAGGARQEIQVPPQPTLSFGGGGPPPEAFSLQGNTLSAPASAATGGATAPQPFTPAGPAASTRPLNQPQSQPQPPAPQQPQPPPGTPQPGSAIQ